MLSSSDFLLRDSPQTASNMQVQRPYFGLDFQRRLTGMAWHFPCWEWSWKEGVWVQRAIRGHWWTGWILAKQTPDHRASRTSSLARKASQILHLQGWDPWEACPTCCNSKKCYSAMATKGPQSAFNLSSACWMWDVTSDLAAQYRRSPTLETFVSCLNRLNWQEAEQEKEEAGEGRNVEHVALAVDKPEEIEQRVKKHNFSVQATKSRKKSAKRKTKQWNGICN